VTALRRAGVLVGFAIFVLAAAVFAYANPGSIAVDLGFARLDEVSIAGAFVTAFAIGALFGMACTAFAYLRVSAERRRLRRHLTAAEAELGRLRSAPLQHAD
jgi:uncharacterized integral membrane protein